MSIEGGIDLSQDNAWAEQLRQTLKEAIHEFFHHTWTPFENEADREGFASDVLDTAEVVAGLEVLELNSSKPMMQIYASVDSSITSVAEVRNCVHQLLSLVEESFLIVVPHHNEEALHFWFMTGTKSHGHEGMVILRRKDIPHMRD